MSKLLDQCKKCVDQVFIDWEKCVKLPKEERRCIEEYQTLGIVHLAMYILSFDEYNKFKYYIYKKHGYDVGGATDGQMSVEECSVDWEDR